MQSAALALGVSRRFAAITVAALVLLVVGAFMIDYLAVLDQAASVALDNLGTAIAAVIAALLCLTVAAATVPRKLRLAWLFLGAGFTGSAVAEFIWFYFQTVARVEAPFPSIADAFYLSLYPLAFVAVLLMANPGAGGVRKAVVVFDSLLFAMALFGLAWQSILAPTIAEVQSLSRLGIALSVAYPAFDLLLVFALASLFLSWDLRHVPRPLLWLLAGIVIMVIADLGFARQLLQGEYDFNSVFDPLWTLSYALVAVSALLQLRDASAYDADDAATPPTTVNLERTRLLRLAIPYLALPAAAALIVLHLERNGGGIDGDAILVLAYSVLLLGLVLARQFLTLLENARLSRSLSARTNELAMLNRVATDLSHCLTTDEVVRTGLERACDALHASDGAVWLLDADHATRLAACLAPADGNYPPQSCLATERSSVASVLGLPATHVVDLDDRPATHNPQRIDPANSPRLLVVPLMSRGSVLGSLGLTLTASEADAPARRQLLEAIGAQLGVAVGNAQQYEQARALAERDSLTGLLNHRAFQSRLEAACKQGERDGKIFSVVMMDLDGFKRLNDSLGHQAGDAALRQVATHLQQCLRDTDVVGRYGGDEFVALLPNTDKNTARGLCERLRESLIAARGPLALTDVSVAVRLSFGVASYPADGVAARALVGIADHNLYASKLCGGNRVTVTDDGGEGRAVAPSAWPDDAPLSAPQKTAT